MPAVLSGFQCLQDKLLFHILCLTGSQNGIAENVADLAKIIKAFAGSDMALLKLTDKYAPQRLEAACCKAFSFTVSPSLKSIQAILRSGQDKLSEQEMGKLAASQYGFTRGAGYYDGRDD